jgi:hypothetical protein
LGADDAATVGDLVGVGFLVGFAEGLGDFEGDVDAAGVGAAVGVAEGIGATEGDADDTGAE